MFIKSQSLYIVKLRKTLYKKNKIVRDMYGRVHAFTDIKQ